MNGDEKDVTAKMVVNLSLATSIQQMNREGGYGYFFWKYREVF